MLVNSGQSLGCPRFLLTITLWWPGPNGSTWFTAAARAAGSVCLLVRPALSFTGWHVLIYHQLDLNPGVDCSGSDHIGLTFELYWSCVLTHELATASFYLQWRSEDIPDVTQKGTVFHVTSVPWLVLLWSILAKICLDTRIERHSKLL